MMKSTVAPGLSVYEPHDCFPHLPLYEDQVRNRHVMARINVTCKRTERAVRHAHDDFGHMLEGIRHGQKENLQSVDLRLNVYESFVIQSLACDNFKICPSL